MVLVLQPETNGQGFNLKRKSAKIIFWEKRLLVQFTNQPIIKSLNRVKE